jgi:hypothetical protein
MSPLNKSLISLAIVFATSGISYAVTDSSADGNTVRADFKNKLLLIPCVEVTNTPFDGFWDVVMEISGTGTGLDWKVIKANKSAADECDSAPDNNSTDELLKSMGMPSVAELIKNGGKDDSADEPKPSPSPTQTAIENIVNNSINNTIPKN